MDEQSGRGGGAAPFRRPEHKRKQKPLQPGRGKGHEGSFRQKPERVDRTVESPLLCCPHCRGAVQKPRAVEQYLIDIAPVEPVVTRIITTHAYCPGCRRRVRSTHPLQVSTATGAAGVHLGPRALALGAQLRHVFGLTMSKTYGVQQKCYAHHLIAISKAREEKGEGAVEENGFLAQCRHLLVRAIEQSRRWSQLSAAQKLSRRRILQMAAEGLLQ